MRCGDIILFKNEALLSRIIRWFTRSPYSHAAIAVDEIHVYETNYNTNAHIKHIDCPARVCDIYRLKPGIKYDTKRLKMFMKNHLSNKYDMGEIFKIIFKINTPDNDGKYICSMLVRDAFLEQGIDLTPGIEIPTPEDLRRSKLLYKVEVE